MGWIQAALFFFRANKAWLLELGLGLLVFAVICYIAALRDKAETLKGERDRYKAQAQTALNYIVKDEAARRQNDQLTGNLILTWEGMQNEAIRSGVPACGVSQPLRDLIKRMPVDARRAP